MEQPGTINASSLNPVVMPRCYGKAVEVTKMLGAVAVDGAQNLPEKKWCAWCGVWGNHTSGGCDDLKEALKNIERAERGKSPNAGTQRPEAKTKGTK